MRTRITNKVVSELQPGDKRIEVYDTDFPGLILRVQPSGRMTYFYRYRLENGKQSKVLIGSTVQLSPIQARDLAKQKAAEVLSGIDPVDKKREARAERTAHTLETFLTDVYAPWVETRYKRGAESVSRVKSAFPSLLTLPLGDVTTWLVEKVRSARLKEGRQPTTVNRDISALKAVFSRAVEWGHLKEDPLKVVKPQRIDTRGRVRFLSSEERLRLLKSLDAREERIRTARDSHNEWLDDRNHEAMPDLRKVAYADLLKPFVLTALHTGMRRGELFSLCWEHVDLERRVLTVVGETAKSGSSRTIPLNSVILDVLSKWREQSAGEGLVFPSPVTGERLNNIKKSWTAVLKKAKIDGFTFHDLRHTFASELVQRGVDLVVVRELLGHAGWKMTLRYSHLLPRQGVDAVEKLVAADNVIPFEKAEGEKEASTE